MTADDRELIQDARDLKADVAVMVMPFAGLDVRRGAMMAFHLVGLAHEITLCIADGNQEIALEMLSEAVNHSKRESYEIWQKISKKTRKQKQK